MRIWLNGELVLREAPLGKAHRVPVRSIRRATARQMALSWSQIPHVTSQDEADITDLEDIPNVGPSIAANLRLVGIQCPDDLLGKNPYTMYDDLGHVTGVRQWDHRCGSRMPDDLQLAGLHIQFNFQAHTLQWEGLRFKIPVYIQLKIFQVLSRLRQQAVRHIEYVASLWRIELEIQLTDECAQFLTIV